MENLALVGLGAMGRNLAWNLLGQGVPLAVYSYDADELERFLRTPAQPARSAPSLAELIRMGRALIQIAWWMTRQPDLRWHYWRNTWSSLLMGMARFEFCQSHMAGFMHLKKQTARAGQEMQVGIDYAKFNAAYPRSTEEMKPTESAILPVIGNINCSG